MPQTLCFANCQNYQRELAAIIELEGWNDVESVHFPASCGKPPLTWETLRLLLPSGCSQLILMGRACLANLGNPPPDFPPLRMLSPTQCFHLLASADLVDEAIARGAYLLTPGWLEHWPERLAGMGFTQEMAGEFLRDCARELLLLDTGVCPGSQEKLAEFSAAMGLPAARIAVGLDTLRAKLSVMALEWRLSQAQQAHARELADRMAAMDFLERLARSTQESEAIGTIEELFRMLFAPEELYYLRVENGLPAQASALPPGWQETLLACPGDHAYTPSGRGFLLRIAYDGQTLGLLGVERLAFPEYRERYLNLALAMSGVLGLAIENARTHKRLLESEKMASLGYLVAGVAHEINTPLGIGLTAASSLQEQAQALAEQFAAHTLTQSGLRGFLDNGLTEARLIRSNLERIGQLIDAFRQVAVQGSPAKSRFRLRDCLDEVVRAHGPRLKAAQAQVEIQCPAALEIESFPGDWATVFSNLLANSLKHGFQGRPGRSIGIRAESRKDRLVIDYRDDGAGIAPGVLERIFDPFFTTDLGHGMGLGLHLVYNLVTQRLGGSIACDGRPGQGAHFHLEFPR